VINYLHAGKNNMNEYRCDLCADPIEKKSGTCASCSEAFDLFNDSFPIIEDTFDEEYEMD
jgi:hypothetical protein